MNIFVLDTNIQRCAEYHNDKHVVKMILETTQLLNNALSVANKDYKPIYRITHKKHPCSVWATESIANFNWLLDLGLALCSEYFFRYNRRHKCEEVLKLFGNINIYLPQLNITPFKLCMPNEYKIIGNPVLSYRNYYMGSKRHIAKWSVRGVPEWWT